MRDYTKEVEKGADTFIRRWSMKLANMKSTAKFIIKWGLIAVGIFTAGGWLLFWIGRWTA